MPFYVYTCGSCNSRFTRFLHMRDYKKTVRCDCGRKGKRIVTCPNINTNPHRWDLKPVPGKPDQMENERAVVHFHGDHVDSDGLPMAEIPELPPPKQRLPPNATRKDKQEYRRYRLETMPTMEECDIPRGEVHPLKWRKDERLTQKLRLESIKE